MHWETKKSCVTLLQYLLYCGWNGTEHITSLRYAYKRSLSKGEEKTHSE